MNNNLAANTLISSGYNTAYNNAMNQFNADQTRNLQTQQAQESSKEFGANLGLQGLQAATSANQALGQNTQMQNQNQLANLQAQGSAGATQQGLAQAADTAAYNQYLFQLQYPQQMLTAQENAFKSVPTTNLLTYGTTPSTFQDIASVGGGLQSLLSAIGGNQPAGSGTSSTMAGVQNLYNLLPSSSSLQTAYNGLTSLLGGGD